MNWLGKLLRPLAVLADLSVTCKEASRLQSEALDRRLALRQRVGLRMHLWLCAWCRRYGRQLEFLRSVAHRHDEVGEPSPSQNLSVEARERIQERLRNEPK